MLQGERRKRQVYLQARAVMLIHVSPRLLTNIRALVCPYRVINEFRSLFILEGEKIFSRGFGVKRCRARVVLYAGCAVWSIEFIFFFRSLIRWVNVVRENTIHVCGYSIHISVMRNTAL